MANQKKFKAKEIIQMDGYSQRSKWVIVTDDEKEVIVVEIPHYAWRPASLAQSLSQLMNNGGLNITKLI